MSRPKNSRNLPKTTLIKLSDLTAVLKEDTMIPVCKLFAGILQNQTEGQYKIETYTPKVSVKVFNFGKKTKKKETA